LYRWCEMPARVAIVNTATAKTVTVKTVTVKTVTVKTVTVKAAAVKAAATGKAAATVKAVNNCSGRVHPRPRARRHRGGEAGNEAGDERLRQGVLWGGSPRYSR